jgi:hypothetical protein
MGLKKDMLLVFINSPNQYFEPLFYKSDFVLSTRDYIAREANVVCSLPGKWPWIEPGTVLYKLFNNREAG